MISHHSQAILDRPRDYLISIIIYDIKTVVLQKVNKKVRLLRSPSFAVNLWMNEEKSRKVSTSNLFSMWSSLRFRSFFLHLACAVTGFFLPHLQVSNKNSSQLQPQVRECNSVARGFYLFTIRRCHKSMSSPRLCDTIEVQRQFASDCCGGDCLRSIECGHSLDFMSFRLQTVVRRREA